MSLKNRINKYLRKFNVELHGLGYLQSLGKNEFKNSEVLNSLQETISNNEKTISELNIKLSKKEKNITSPEKSINKNGSD